MKNSNVITLTTVQPDEKLSYDEWIQKLKVSSVYIMNDIVNREEHHRTLRSTFLQGQPNPEFCLADNK